MSGRSAGVRANAAAVAILAVFLASAGGVLAWGSVAEIPTILAATPSALLGALLVSRRPRNAVSWLTAMLGQGVAAIVAAQSFAQHAVATGSDGALVAAWIAGWLRMPIELAALVLLPLLFPDGAPPSRRWRPVVAVVIAAITVSAALGIVAERVVVAGAPFDSPLGIAGIPPADVNPLLIPLWPLGFGVAVAAMTVRFIRSTGVERLQVKWFLVAAALLITLPVAEVAAPAVVSDIAFVTVLCALPAAVAVAVLRYRLYDIDRVINRTVVYSVVSGVLAVAYLATVTTIRALTAGWTGDTAVAVAGSTLAVAALFRPVRNRVQATVDRRFNRARYDAAATVDRLRLRFRDELDLEALRLELVATVCTTMQPAGTALWLREPQR